MNAIHIRPSGYIVTTGGMLPTLCGLERPFENTVPFPANAESFIRGNSDLCPYCASTAQTGIPRRHPKAEVNPQ